MTLKGLWLSICMQIQEYRDEKRDKKAFRQFRACVSGVAHLPAESNPISRLFMILLVKWLDSGLEQVSFAHRECSCLWASDIWPYAIETYTWVRWLSLIDAHATKHAEHDLFKEYRMDVHRDGQAIPIYFLLQRYPNLRDLNAIEEQMVKLQGQPELIVSRQPMKAGSQA